MELNKLEGLPLSIRTHYDPDAGDTDSAVDRRERESTIGETFTLDQIEITAKLLERRQIDPISFAIAVSHEWGGHRNGAEMWNASVRLACKFDVRSKEVELINKRSTDEKDWIKWRDAAGWIELSDLEMSE